MSLEDVLSIECPTCGAAAGRRCGAVLQHGPRGTRLHGYYSLAQSHIARRRVTEHVTNAVVRLGGTSYGKATLMEREIDAALLEGKRVFDGRTRRILGEGARDVTPPERPALPPAGIQQET